MTWRWARSREIGTSHVRRQQPCQDAFFSLMVNNTFVSAVCDGAGSADYGGSGAWISCREIKKLSTRYIRGTNKLPTNYIFSTWVSAAIRRIEDASLSLACRPREFASTLVFVASNGNETFIAHIGDGCAAVRNQSTKNWTCPTWPTKGQYASSTCFITDAKVRLKLAMYEEPIDRLALFSVGLESLILNYQNRAPYEGFLNSLSNSLTTFSESGHTTKVSNQLKGFVNSERVLERTDDDKTIVVAVR